MSSSDAEGYIANAVQYPRPMHIAWDSIDRGSETRDQIREDTTLSDSQIADSIAGLQYLRLIEDAEGFTAVPLRYGEVAPEPPLNFGLTAMNNIMSESEPPEWSKQAVIPLTLAYLIDTNTQLFNRKDGGLAKKINDWHRGREYRPIDPNTGNEIDMNKKKLQNWTFIAEYFGLVRNISGVTYTTYLAPKLVWTLLCYGVDRLPDQAGGTESHPAISIRGWFEWVSREFYPISLTNQAEIPEIVAETFAELSRQGLIRLVEAGDQGAVSLQGLPRLDTMEAGTNSIEVIQ